MKRRDSILALLALGAAARSSIAIAQPAMPLRRIATLDDAHEASRAREWAAFRKRLQELGYTESKGYVIEARWADAQAKRLPELAAELVSLKAEVIVTAGSSAALAAKRATSSIPIVFIAGIDPVKMGLVSSFSRPEGNLTGVTNLTTDIAVKWLELMREIAPKARSFAMLSYTDSPGGKQILQDLQERAKPFGIAVQSLDGRNRANVERAFATMARERVGALIVTSTGALLDQRQQIVEAAARQRIPAVYGRREYAEAGGLVSYGANLLDLERHAATYVDKILRGAKPADLPVEQPTKFELVINLKTAKALGITIPQSVLARADEVIE